MIEHLALAAEITAALLLLSLAIPRSGGNKSSHSEDESVGVDVLKRAETSLQTLQLLSLWAISQNRRHSRDDSEEASYSASAMLGRLMPEVGRLMVSSPADGMTGLRDRKALENLFEAAEPWLAAMQHPIQVALIQPDNIEAIDEKHGPIAGEKAVQHTATLLQEFVGGNGLVVRYGFYSFGIAVVGRTQSQAVRLIESLRRRLSTEPMMIEDESKTLTFSASLPVGNTSSGTEQLWELAEDGLAYSIAQGGNLGHYFDASDATWKPMSLTGTTDDETASDSESGTDTNSDLGSEGASTSEQAETTEAVADTESTSLKDEVPTAETSAPAEPTAAAPAKPEKVSSDDIAALFQAAQKPTAKPASKAGAASPDENALQSKNSTTGTAGDSTVQANTMATADDIAALFAAVKETAKPVEEALKQRDPIVAEEAKKKYDAPALKSDEELSTAASEDDIAALFAAFKK